MNRFPLLLLVISFMAIVLAPAATLAGGDTYKRVVCSEEDYDDVKKQKCKFKFKLKPLQTKEFRGHCEYTDKNGKTSTDKPRNQDCNKNNSANSCTGTWDKASATASSDYLSCSCTNWDVTTSHNVKVMINC